MINFITRNSTFSRQLRLLILLRGVDSITTAFFLVTDGAEGNPVIAYAVSRLGIILALSVATIVVAALALPLQRIGRDHDFVHPILCVANSVYIISLTFNFLHVVMGAVIVLRGYMIWLS